MKSVKCKVNIKFKNQDKNVNQIPKVGTMIVKVIGDSNFRDLFSQHREEMETDTQLRLDFVYATSVASVKTALEGLEAQQEAILIAAPTNEISLKSRNNTKSREGIIETVVSDLYNCVNNYANKHDHTLMVVCQPFLRMEPPWIEAKMRHYLDYLKSTHNSSASSNVHLGSEVEGITINDLKQDKVHLNKEGLTKLRNVIVSDLKTTKTEVEILRKGGSDEDEDEESMDHTPINEPRNLRNTPARRKRPLDDSPDDGKSKKKRSKDRIDAVLDKLDLMMGRMNEDRISNRDRFDKIDERLDVTIQEQDNLKKEIETIKKNDNTFSASLREDLDAVENSNARDTVIIKRVTLSRDIPRDKKELTNLVVSEGKEILTLILGNSDGMKFISPLFINNNKRGTKPGTPNPKELPPFKIVFKHLSEAITFKEKCIAASKDPQHRLHKVYVTNQQSIGTRIRLSIMWGIADLLKKEKKDCWVSQSVPKPTLMVKETGNLVRTYSYIEAVSTYGDKIDQKIKDEATALAKRFFYGQVEKIFIILKD